MNVSSRARRRQPSGRRRDYQTGSFSRHSRSAKTSRSPVIVPAPFKPTQSKGNLLRTSASVGGRFQPLSENDYDGFGNLIEVREYSHPDGRGPPSRTRLEYDSDSIAVIRAIDGLGNDSWFEVDHLGRPERVERSRTISTGEVEIVRAETEYDPLDRPVETRDGGGVLRTTVFDDNGLVLLQSTVAGALFRIDEENTYDAGDRLVQQTNALGQDTTFVYDSRSRVIETRSPLGHRELRKYDLDSNEVELTDPAGSSTRYEYDGEARLIKVVDALGRESPTDYDREGRVVRSVGPGNRLLYEVIEYDAVGNALRVRDGEAHETVRVFDELNRPVQATDPVGTTLYDYDLTGRLVSRTDGEGHSITVRYDALGRVTEATDALGRARYAGYDELGNLVETVSAAGERVELSYDRRGLLLGRRGQAVDDRFAYDPLGRPTGARSPQTSKSFEYDLLDRVVAARDAYAGAERRLYDEDGRLIQLIYLGGRPLGFPAPNEEVALRYQYNERGQIVGIVDPQMGFWRFEYDPIGRLVRRVDPDGVETAVEYTPEGFTDRIDLVPDVGANEFVDYAGYDALGNPGQITTADEELSVVYDARSRVEEVTYDRGAVVETEEFRYDRADNRIGHVTRSGQDRTYCLDAADQLTKVVLTNGPPATSCQSGTAIQSFGHDAAGRRVSRQIGSVTTTYQYDALGQLMRVKASDGYALRLYYDGLRGRHRRIETGQPDAFFVNGLVEHRSGQKFRLVRAGGSVLAEISNGVMHGLHRDGSGNVSELSEGGRDRPDPALRSFRKRSRGSHLFSGGPGICEPASRRR